MTKRARRRRRIRRVVVGTLRRSFRLARFAPSLGAFLAEALFRRPPKHVRLRREERQLAIARFSMTRTREGSIPTWIWGKGPPVLLVHGWGGHAGRLTEFVRPLLRAGFSVISFDAPGHGDARGRFSGLPEFVDSIRAIARAHGPLRGAIGHSLGAAACALAAKRGVLTSRVVLLAPPAEAEKYTGKFARSFRMTPRTHEAMKRRLERRYRIRWSDLVVAAGGCPVEVLVFHDVRDGKIPFQDGESVARSWPNAELVRTRGLGHHRILSDRRVISRAVAFVARGPVSAPVRRRRRPTPLSPAFAS